MIAILCTSPLHIMTAFSLKMNQYKNEDMQMILLDYSVDAERLRDRIIQTGLFSDVYYLKAHETFDKYTNDRLYRIKFLIKGITVIEDAGIPWRQISELLFPYRDPIIVLLARHLNKMQNNCRYVYYDDGTALYVDSGTMICDKPSRLELLLSVPRELYNPSKGFVFAPELLDFSKDVQLHKISFIREKEFVDTLNFVFEYKKIIARNYIIFDCCDVVQDTPLDIEEIEQIIHIVKSYMSREDVYVKKHPKRKGTYYEDAGLEVFPSRVSLPFEMFLLNERCTEDSVLVSEFSTAAVTPILMFGDEPKIVFLHHMMKFFSKDMKYEIDRFLQKISRLYKDKDKVCISYSELNLKQFLEKGL